MAWREARPCMSMRLAEAVAAGAALLGVGVIDVEPGALEAVDPVDGGALEHRDAGPFNAHRHAVEVDGHVVVEFAIIEVEGVAHTGATARLHGHTQEDALGVLFGFHELAYLVNRGGGQGDDFRGPNLLSHTQMVPGTLNPPAGKNFSPMLGVDDG